MQITPKVKEILSWYEGENPGVKGNLARLMMTGRLAGTGKLVILPVDQGYEHGPARSFAANPPAYDPHYLYQLAIDAGLSGYAAPLGPLEQGADTFAGQVPTILKMNSANSLATGIPDQAVTASVKDALRLGCTGVGFTIYPGSDECFAMMEEFRDIIREAKASGLVAVLWSYPRGGAVTKEGETAIDIVAYAAHMAALLGANIIKVKPPSDHLDLPAAKKVYEAQDIDRSTLSARISHVMQSSFAGKRLVVFSGGDAKGTDGLLNEIRQIRDGGGSGSIIGRNSFQRSKADAMALLDEVIKIYRNESLNLADGTIDPTEAGCQLVLIGPPIVEPGFADALDAAVAGGAVAAFLLWPAPTDAAAIVAQAAAIVRPVCVGRRLAFLVQGNPELALELDADGVHLEHVDAVGGARDRLGAEHILGASCGGSRDQAMAAGETGADYVAFGSPGVAPDDEVLDLIGWWSELFVLPCLALGPSEPSGCAALVRAGADFIAARGAVWDHPDGPASGAEALRAAIAAA